MREKQVLRHMQTTSKYNTYKTNTAFALFYFSRQAVNHPLLRKLTNLESGIGTMGAFGCLVMSCSGNGLLRRCGAGRALAILASISALGGMIFAARDLDQAGAKSFRFGFALAGFVNNLM